MGRLTLSLLPLVLLVAASVLAQTPTPLVLNVNRDLKIVVSYPLEVKYSSWVRVVFDVTSITNVTVDKFAVRFVLVHDRGSVTLYEALIIQSKAMAPGSQVQRVIEFQASIPAPRPPADPFLELHLIVNYSVGGVVKFLEYKAPITIVPPATYSELQAALSGARQKAELADQLAKQVKTLEIKLANESGKCAVISEQLKSLSSEWNLLKEKVGALQAENIALKNRISKLEEENSALRIEISSLREEKGGLSSRLTSVQDSYAALEAELDSLKQKYESVLAEASTLKVALAVAASTVVALIVLLVLQKKSAQRPLPPPPPP